MSTRRQFIKFTIFSMVLSSGTFITACGSNKVDGMLLSDTEVTALGDSLTFGYGVEGSKNGADYPTQLAQLTGWKVTNAGVNGDTTQDVLNRLDKIIATKPKLVLLGIGGNDVLQRIQPSTIKNNLINIITQLQSSDIPVVLIAQPYFSASALLGKASDNPVYKEVAEELNVPLYAGGWSKILSDESLKSDQIHANALGYRQFAEGLYDYLQKIGYAKPV